MSFKIGDRVRAKHDHSFVAVIGSSLAMRDKPPFSLTVEFGGLLYDAPASWFERVPEVRVECACGFAHFCKAAHPPEKPEPLCAHTFPDGVRGLPPRCNLPKADHDHGPQDHVFVPAVKPEVPVEVVLEMLNTYVWKNDALPFMRRKLAERGYDVESVKP